MGKDIHMHIIENGKVIKKEIYDGRNSEWFSNISGSGHDFEYDYLPVKYNWGIEDNTIIDENLINYTSENGYFDFRRIKVEDFLNWYHTYKPYLKAGWVSKYDAWRIKNKNYIPECLPIYKPDDSDEYEFIEYKDNYDCSMRLYNYIAYQLLNENKITKEAEIIYCFDW